MAELVLGGGRFPRYSIPPFHAGGDVQRLNSSEGGEAVFFLHDISGSTDMLKPLCSCLEQSCCYGIQLTPDAIRSCHTITVRFHRLPVAAYPGLV